jgi:hypothetical protein
MQLTTNLRAHDRKMVSCFAQLPQINLPGPNRTPAYAIGFSWWRFHRRLVICNPVTGGTARQNRFRVFRVAGVIGVSVMALRSNDSELKSSYFFPKPDRTVISEKTIRRKLNPMFRPLMSNGGKKGSKCHPNEVAAKTT